MTYTSHLCVVVVYLVCCASAHVSGSGITGTLPTYTPTKSIADIETTLEDVKQSGPSSARFGHGWCMERLSVPVLVPTVLQETHAFFSVPPQCKLRFYPPIKRLCSHLKSLKPPFLHTYWETDLYTPPVLGGAALLTIQQQRCIKTPCPKDPQFLYAGTELSKGQQPAPEVCKNKSPTYVFLEQTKSFQCPSSSRDLGVEEFSQNYRDVIFMESSA